jgi:tetratricopeptide (TPR) repeat protein
MMLGLIYGEKNDSVTIQYYQTASKLKPEEIQPHYNLGLLYQDNVSVNEAINEYQFIIRNIDKSYPNAYFNQGYIYMIYVKDYNKAISYFDSSLTYKTDYVEAIYNKGFCYEKLKDYNKARELYNQAKEMVTNYQLAIDGLNRLDKKNK